MLNENLYDYHRHWNRILFLFTVPGVREANKGERDKEPFKHCWNIGSFVEAIECPQRIMNVSAFSNGRGSVRCGVKDA